MSAKDCGHHRWYERHHKYLRWFCAFLVIFVIAVLFTVFVIWLVLRPTKPKFSLRDATVFNFNLSTDPSLLTSTLQVTFSSRNPNRHIGIYYDRLDVYASYKSQQITVPVGLPPLYQGHKDVTVWSPYLFGVSIPIAPYLAVALSQDENAGAMLLRVQMDGRVRWKVGSWVSDRYHLFVSCPAYLTFNNGDGGGPVIRFQQISYCKVDV